MSEPYTREFPNTGEALSGYYAACRWLDENGYSHGSTERDKPIGILKGNVLAGIPKWRHILRRNNLDGRITWKGGGLRDGTAVVELKAAP